MNKIRNPVARAAHQRGGVHCKSRKAERRKARIETHKLAAIHSLSSKPGSTGLFLARA